MPSTNNLPAQWADRSIVALRPPKNPVDPRRPYAYLVEKERSAEGVVEDVATIFLTNKECPFRCLMCDLWKNTLESSVPPGAIPEQIGWALARLPPARSVKLYNSGNFFDPQAIPESDYPAVAEAVSPFRKVIVESHPRMIGPRCVRFQEMVGDRLQVAMGLETAHPGVLARLNKRMTLEDFERATAGLVARGVQVRAFILLRPPFLDESEGVTWAKRSLDFAFDIGVECCAVIPTRGGNGVMEVLSQQGDFEAPTLTSLEEVIEYGVGLRRGRVLADLWDIERLASNGSEERRRIERLKSINLAQRIPADHGASSL